MKKQYSLKRHILGIGIIFYSILLFLLLFITFFSISSYRAQNIEKLEARYEKLYESQREKLSNLDNDIIRLYLNNSNVKILKNSQNRLEKYEAEVGLNDQMLNRMCFDNDMMGFYFCYDGYERYSFNTMEGSNLGAANTDIRRALYRYLSNYMRSTEQGFSRHIFEMDGSIYYLAAERGSSAGVLGMELLAGEKENVEDEKGRQTVVLVEYNNMLLGLENGLEALHMEKSPAIIQELLNAPEGQWNSIALNHKNYYLYKESNKDSDYCLYLMVEYALADFLGLYQIALLALIPFSFFLFLLIYKKLKTFMIGALYEMSETMNEIRDGNWAVRPLVTGHYEEINQVGRTLEMLLSEIERLKIRSYEEKMDVQRTQLQYMQLQLKPHFYMNCMKMLNALLGKKDYRRMRELIFSISAHMRYLLYHDNMLITLEEELNFVKNYVEMQKNLSGRQIQLEISMESEVLQWQIPILCLQTFIENSFKYSGTQDAVLKIQIDAVCLKMEGKQYADIVIRDNGKGYPDEILEVLRKAPGAENERLGVGIINLEKRFQLLFDKTVEYNFYNQDGAVSEMVIPMKEKNEDEAVTCG